MSQFLWVEDFAGNTLKSATETVFGERIKNQPIGKTEKSVKQLLTKNGVFVELTFLGGLEFIRNPKKWLSIDYVILDIDLAITSDLDTDDNQWLPKILQDYYGYEPQEDEIADELHFEKAKEQLIPVAGYQLYIELVMEIGFPKEHILFCSNHADEQKTIQAVFKKARIELPLLLSKDDKAKVQTWIRKRSENHYAVLRRGIIEGCQEISACIKNSPDQIQFGQFIKKQKGATVRDVTVKDMQEYLETLQNLLPLREPQELPRFYKLFLRTLTHEWDSADIKKLQKSNKLNLSFGWIMKNARNWSTHTTVLDKSAAPDIAFLFMVAMRSMFKLDNTAPQPYETYLLSSLFEETPDLKINKIPLAATYLNIKNQFLNVRANNASDFLDFHAMLNHLVNKAVDLDYVTGLFQMFWHGLAPAKLATSEPAKVTNNTNKYSFDTSHGFGNAENGFLFKFARSIYKRSFP